MRTKGRLYSEMQRHVAYAMLDFPQGVKIHTGTSELCHDTL